MTILWQDKLHINLFYHFSNEIPPKPKKQSLWASESKIVFGLDYWAWGTSYQGKLCTLNTVSPLFFNVQLCFSSQVKSRNIYNSRSCHSIDPHNPNYRFEKVIDWSYRITDSWYNLNVWIKIKGKRLRVLLQAYPE